MITFVKLWCVLTLVAAFSLKEMTEEEKRVENALFKLVGEEPPNEILSDHKDLTLPDVLFTNIKIAQDSHVGGTKNNTETKSKAFHSDHNHSTLKDPKHCKSHDEEHSMNKWFHFGFKEVVLFDFWKIEDTTGLIITCFLWFTAGIVYELLKWYRVYITLHKKWKRKESFHLPTIVTVTDGRALKEDFKDPAVPLMNNSTGCAPIADRPSPFSFVRAAQAFLYILQLVLAYSLMLVVMTFNVWLSELNIIECTYNNVYSKLFQRLP
ncbi:unnamed protein product [Caenorhabditis brenneri]